MSLIRDIASEHYFELISEYFYTRISDSRKSEVKLQTIRVESTAVRLFVALLQDSNSLTQALRTFSAQSPGHLNALSKFCTFWGEALDTNVEVPKNVLALRLAFLVSKSQKEVLPEKLVREYLSLALVALHRVKLAKQGKLNYQKVHDGYLVNIGEHSYWLPLPN